MPEAPPSVVVAPLGDSVTTTRAVPEVSAMVLIAASSMYVVDGVTATVWPA